MGRTTRTLRLAICGITLLAQPAIARADLGFLLGFDFGKESISNTSSSAEGSYTTGLRATQDLALGFSLEADFLLVGRRYTYDENSTDTMQLKQAFFQIPVFARYTFFPGISFGLGPYFQTGLGNIGETESLDGTEQPSQTQTYSGNRNRADLGLASSLGFELPVGPRVSLTGDLRLLWGFVNQSGFPASAGDISIYNRMFQVLFGVSFAL